MSRAGRHFVFISFLGVGWIVPVLRVFFEMIEGDPTKRTPMVNACIPERFLTLRCIPIGIDFVLPFVIFAILMRGSWTVYHRAVAVHGEEEEASIALPPRHTSSSKFLSFQSLPSRLSSSFVDARSHGRHRAE
ncbi:hypothetical protein MSAN_01816500 [Mycena sanguinolenta]|uniref:Uncharacterized protein n=1 Tax=Mycena sanguinolenta TaxID=230812 RepID=A0A8H7CQU2_9AGAR|nr:hypothetical protein MSAN_01816500 [Mycena sanguinolenta]